MSKQLLQPFLFVFVCGALLFLATTLSQHTTASDVFKDARPLPKREVTSTHLLWESLSRQFVSAVQY